jgi:hypothetical protein
MDAEKAARSTKIHVLSIDAMVAKFIEAIQNHTPVSDVYKDFEFDLYK